MLTSHNDRGGRFGFRSRIAWFTILLVCFVTGSWMILQSTGGLQAHSGWVKWPKQYLGPGPANYPKLHKAPKVHLAPDATLQAQCGNWQLSYKQMHRAWLKANRTTQDANPAIIYDCTGIYCSGLADRLLGMTSTFLVAAMSGRPFFANWASPLSLEYMFDKVHIDWQAPQFLLAESVPLLLTNLVPEQIDGIFNMESWRLAGAIPQNLPQRALMDPWHLKVYNNRGLILRSYQYPHISQQLSAAALPYGLAYQCIFTYLFKPNEYIFTITSEYTKLLKSKDTYSVGIHIRTGDTSMSSSGEDAINVVDDWSYYFDCAEHLSSRFKLPHQRTVFFVVSDSALLKSTVAERWPDKVIVTDIKPGHIAAGTNAAQLRVAHAALAELLLLTKTDARVISGNSGFGKMAALLSGSNNTVTLPRGSMAGMAPDQLAQIAQCASPEPYTDLVQFSLNWSLA